MSEASLGATASQSPVGKAARAHWLRIARAADDEAEYHEGLAMRARKSAKFWRDAANGHIVTGEPQGSSPKGSDS